jgi:IclR family pca regulon transcriptional regulator
VRARLRGEENKRYFLRPQVLALGHAYLASTPLAVSAQPFLDEVSRQVHESCSASVLDGDDIVYVCRSAQNRILSISLMVGTRLPAYCTAMGQVLLAGLPSSELERYLDACGWSSGPGAPSRRCRACAR